MEYEVKVKGVEDVERLERAIENLDSAMRASRGAGKSLEEVRKIITGFKGQASVFESLRNSVASLQPAIKGLENSFKGIGEGMSRTIKSEMELTRQVFRTELAGIAMGMGGKVAKAISDDIGGSVEKGMQQTAIRAKSAAAKARAEMTKAYEQLVGGDGLKQLTKDQLGEVGLLKGVGATISPFHAAMLKNETSSLQSQRRVEQTFQEHNNRMIAMAEKARREMSAIQVRQNISNFEQSLGIDRAATIKSAKDSASVFARAYSVELARTKEQLAGFERAIGIDNDRIVKSARESAAVFATAYEASIARARMSVAAATNATAAPYQRYNPSTGTAGSLANTLKTSADFDSSRVVKATGDLGRFSTQAGDAHAAVRGLASGFNLLWLTWGNLGPLLAGAALSNTFMKAAKDGMEVANTLQTIASLGEASTREMISLNEELMRIGTTSSYGPKETAKAMQTLVLAGMKVGEVTRSMSDVLAFSKAGTTSIENAADVLVSVTTAFGTGAAGISRSSDIIVRAAADSKASVESFGEAMKTASVVGQQFGASQEDVATMISMLANLGITGTAAGTAIRNMYADLSGRTNKTAKIMAQAGIDFRNASTGGMLPLLETTRMMSQEMDRLAVSKGPKAAKDFMQALMSERGNKPMVAALVEFHQAADDTILYANRLEERLGKIQNAAGDTAKANAAMGETTQKAWERAGASLETTLYKAFQNMEPELYRMANSMRDLFNDPSVISGISAVAGSVATLGAALAENAKLIGTGLAVWGAWKLATVGMTAAQTLLTSATVRQTAADALDLLGIRSKTAATREATAATLAQAAADTAGTAASFGFGKAVGRLAGAITGIGVVVAAASFAWDLYKIAKDKALGSTERDTERSNNVIESMRKDTERINKEIKLMEEGKSDADASGKVRAQENFDNSMRDSLNKEMQLRTELNEIKAKSLVLDDKIKNAPAGTNEGRLSLWRAQATDLDRRRDVTSQSLADVQGVISQQQSKFTTEASLLEDATRRRQELAAAQQKKAEEESRRRQGDALKKLGLGAKDLEKYFATGEMPEGSGPDLSSEKGSRAKTAAVHTTYYDESYEQYKKVIDAQQAYMESYYRQGELSAEDYYNYLDSRAQESYERQRAALQAEQAAYASDPKSKKEYQKTGVELQVLDINRATELRKLEAERSEAVASRLTNEQKALAFGEDYIKRLREDESGNEAITRGSEAAAVESARTKIANDFFKTRVRLAETAAVEMKKLDGQGLEDRKKRLAEELEAIRKQEDNALEIVREREAEKKRLRSEGAYGVIRAVENYVTAANDMASQVESLTSGTLKGLEDAFVTFATTGKLSFKSLADFAVAELARIAARQAVSGMSSMVGSLFNAGMNLFGGGATTSSPVYLSSATGVDLGVLPNARGGVYSSPSLSAYSNQIHSSPKYFEFAQGGVFGEPGAGSEAVMPLTRSATGHLGVRSIGQDGGSKVIVNIQNNAGADISVEDQFTDADGNTVINVIAAKAAKMAVSTVAGQMTSNTGEVGKAFTARKKMGM